jgi:pantoate--beta-alanine ligase
MQIFTNLEEWRAFRRNLPVSLSLGFAPTMGNLHLGHLSLFAAAKKENDRVITSLFINPTQFNNPQDFLHYPRTFEEDLTLMEEAGINYCLLPNKASMYPDNYNFQVQEQKLSTHLEGTHRLGHFTGVLTVVMKLLNLVKPHSAYFGEKDYQQYRLIEEMTKAFFMDINIKVCPTIRENSGLAYSSRNNRLKTEEKTMAERFAEIFHQNKPCSVLQEELQHAGIGVEYLEIFQNRLYVAVQIGQVRLIDNRSLSILDEHVLEYKCNSIALSS